MRPSWARRDPRPLIQALVAAVVGVLVVGGMVLVIVLSAGGVL